MDGGGKNKKDGGSRKTPHTKAEDPRLRDLHLWSRAFRAAILVPYAPMASERAIDREERQGLVSIPLCFFLQGGPRLESPSRPD